MSDLNNLTEQLFEFAGEMTPHIVQKAFLDMNIKGDHIPPTMRLKVVDTILERIIFDRNKHYAMRLELLQTLNG